jgi:hypothetical protein
VIFNPCRELLFLFRPRGCFAGGQTLGMFYFLFNLRYIPVELRSDTSSHVGDHRPLHVESPNGSSQKYTHSATNRT